MYMQKIGAVLLLALMGVAVAAGARTLQRSVAIARTSSSSGSNAGSDVKSVLAIAFAEAKAEGANAESISRAAAVDVGKAFAEAWARASGTVFVSGNGQATAEGRSSARAQAEIFGKAIAGAVGEATNGQNFAGSQVNAETVANNIISAVAKVDVKLSTTGGFAQATSEATARVVAEVVAEAIGEAIAFTVKNHAESGAGAVTDVRINADEENTANTSVEVTGNSAADASAVAETEAKTWPFCQEARSCCNGNFHDGNGDSCMNGRFNKHDIGSVRGWKDNNSNQSCQC